MAKTAKAVARKTVARKEKPSRKPIAAKARKAPAKAAGETAASAVGDKQRFTLYGTVTSGPSYTVALMLSLCRYPYSYIHVNMREGQHKQPDYLVKNRYGQVPSLRDRQVFLVQSAAILEYLSDSLKKFEGKSALEKIRVREWLFWQWDKLTVPLLRLRARARGMRQYGDEVRSMYDTETKAALAVIEHELVRGEWIVGKKPTIADVGIYAVVRYAAEAGVDLTPYPSVTAWKGRIEALPGFGTPEQLLPLESRLL